MTFCYSAVFWSVIFAHGEVCAFVFLSGVTAGILYSLPPPTPPHRDCDCWCVTNLSPVSPPPPGLQPCLPCYFACGPFPSSDPHCIWIWSAMETCSVQLEAAASWAFLPFFHPSLFLSSDSSDFLSLMSIIMPMLMDTPSPPLG